MATKTSRRSNSNLFDTNPIEAIREASVSSVKAVGNSFKNDLVKAGGEDFISQLLGIEANKTSHKTAGDLAEGEELVLKEEKEDKEPQIEAAIDYRREIIHAEATIGHQEAAELKAQMDQLRIEIAKLAKSSKELQAITKDLNLDLAPQDPGKMHLNFFEWVINQLQAARIRVENSASWLSTVAGKSNKKDYWSLSKKHGTSFMLSAERYAVTQTG